MSFPATRLSVVERTRSGDEETRRVALATIIEAYWKPVYKYLRLKWSLNQEEAADVTQEFFTVALQKEVVEALRSRARPLPHVSQDVRRWLHRELEGRPSGE